MITSHKKRGINIVLWIVQIILAGSLIWSSFIKLFTPVEELALMWPWVADVPIELLKFTGVVDLLGAFGLIFPGALNIKPQLVVAACFGVITLMICASLFHILRDETSSIGVNVVFGILAAIVVWGRRKTTI